MKRILKSIPHFIMLFLLMIVLTKTTEAAPIINNGSTSSAIPNATKETAIDITNGYTSPSTVTSPYRTPAWYKFTLTNGAFFTFDFSKNGQISSDSSNAFALITPSGKNMSNEFGGYIINQSFPGSYEGDSVKFSSIVNYWADSETISLHESGTYYFVIFPSFYKNYTKHYTFSASFRNYVPIEKATFAKSTFTLYEKGGAYGQSISDTIKISPSNADGHIATYKASNPSIFKTYSDGSLNPFETNGSMGSSTVTAYDERGKKVGSFKVNVLPSKLGLNMDFEGSTTSMTWKVDHVNDGLLDDADYFRIYMQSGGKYKLKKPTPSALN